MDNRGIAMETSNFCCSPVEPGALPMYRQL